MRLSTWFSLLLGTMLASPASLTLAASSDTPSFDPARMWECTQADGSSIYTNKERAGCTLMTLKELSVVPSLDEMPTYRSAHSTPHHEDMAAYGDNGRRAVTGEQRYVPDWARDWHASVASTGAVQAEVCGLYGEWLNLNQKSRGGFYFGSDPSYGGDLSGQNQRGASFSFYDNARYLSLAKVFGAGFVPIGCL
ncbi:MAG TPA: hypothetical protein VFQ02_13370 [Nitrospira sp.]|nr:hypothetical protein [Nitrospira sp.]